MKPMSDSPVFLDSNVCLYLLGEQSPKKEVAEEILSLPQTVINSQVINETINVGVKKFKLSQHKLLAHMDFLLLNCDVVSISFG
jgi:predicted nucleic acid-binding protein